MTIKRDWTPFPDQSLFHNCNYKLQYYRICLRLLFSFLSNYLQTHHPKQSFSLPNDPPRHDEDHLFQLQFHLIQQEENTHPNIDKKYFQV